MILLVAYCCVAERYACDSVILIESIVNGNCSVNDLSEKCFVFCYCPVLEAPGRCRKSDCVLCCAKADVSVGDLCELAVIVLLDCPFRCSGKSLECRCDDRSGLAALVYVDADCLSVVLFC